MAFRSTDPVSVSVKEHGVSVLQVEECTHDDLGCVDVDLLLSDAMTENADLKARLSAMAEELAAANHRADMAQSLRRDTEKRYALAADAREALAVQVKLVHEELAAAEEAAVPVGTLVYGTVSRDLVMAAYRRFSRVGRGPVPGSVTAAVEAAVPEVVAVMEAAGREAVEVVVRREVRRRRRVARR